MKTIQRTTLLLAGLVASVTSWADGTTAGTSVSNTATATYYAPSTTNQLSVTSTIAFTVQELIDVSVTASTGTNVITDQQDVVVGYTISNDGNGSETFKLTTVDAATGDDFDVSSITMYFDGNGDGVFTSADLAYPVNASGDLNLDAGETVTVFVVVDIPTAATGTTADVVLKVTSQTAGASTAAEGTVLAGVGDSGTDAIVAIDNAEVTFTHTYTVVDDPTAPATAVTVTKSVLKHLDPFGNAKAIPGSVTTYQILIKVNSAVDSLVVADTMPAEVTYVTGSAYLIGSDQVGNDISGTGSALSDATVYGTSIDTNGRITLDLGNQSAAGTYTLQFNVTIK
ncbi:hypothetical protein ACQUQU_03900 [Thalassolituus sp. LLYu03]|uniref:hypothetical protein n=1 Tax=Thalassolituus sp. LLYu03 TaxID=3421656 RepID=UPI003D2E1696